MTRLLPFCYFVGLLVLCYILSFQIMHGLARVSKRYVILRLILLPGIILHESAHALGCLLTGTPVTTISFWNETGGSVTHHQPKFSVVTQPIISLLPLPVGIASILFLSHTITTVVWYEAIGLFILLLSIAATLAPSKTDMMHAIEGLLVLLAVFIATYFYFPGAIGELATSLVPINQQIFLVTGLLAGIWLVLLLLHRAIRRF